MPIVVSCFALLAWLLRAGEKDVTICYVGERFEKVVEILISIFGHFA